LVAGDGSRATAAPGNPAGAVTPAPVQRIATAGGHGGSTLIADDLDRANGDACHDPATALHGPGRPDGSTGLAAEGGA